jgi:hypothetical protein
MDFDIPQKFAFMQAKFFDIVTENNSCTDLIEDGFFCESYCISSQSDCNLCNSSLEHRARSPVLQWAVGERVVLGPLL